MSAAAGASAVGGQPDEALVDVLLEALAALGEAGEPATANRFAGAAYASLRRRDPEQAQRINALMHRLVNREKKNERSKQMPTTDPDLDVRKEPPARRHELIFETYTKLGAGEGFVLVNDHDPKPLQYQFEAEHAGEFTWEYLEEGPTVWRVRIGRPAEAAA
ncbi:MAG TPA: DUF2249 domain-containing protein [Solirubrobacterales bacterium]|nr:DUF2249 domain-containing protein [Solirubrobacterales bacterium]